ncbi:helix-turn-helix domain-containing protein [Roseibium sp.]|uniref:helix-turn-helix domain-containing protein n=1 Tax=Roseibium sp. TaxID=1936156 RepID=UPI003264E34A
METLLFSAVVQALFTTAFLISKPKCTLSDGILAVWMVFIALPMISGVAASLWPELRIPVLQADLIYPLTYGPFMWLYVRAVAGDIDKLTKRDLLHFLPFGVVSAAQLATGLAPPPPHPEHIVFDTSTRLVGAFNLALMLSYSVLVVRRLWQHGRDVNQHFSSLPSHVTLKWLFWLIAAFFAVSLVLFLASLLSLPLLLQVHLPAQFAIILGLSFFGLRQDQVFGQHDGRRSEEDEQPRQGIAAPDLQKPKRRTLEPVGDNVQRDDAKKRYSRSGLTEERAERILLKLEACMKEERPYLSAELTIADLAKRMAVPRHHLTEVISTRRNKSFYILVNEYRIEAIKQAMRKRENSGVTLLQLAYANGFNSKSSFNSAFKQLTGRTPSQYRRKLARPGDLGI